MKKHILIFAGTLAALTMSFQNCTKTSYGSKDGGLQRSGGTGTGNGYDGKVYAILSEIPCPDTSNIEAAILVTTEKNEAFLIRESCRTVQAQLLQPQSYNILPGEQLEFRGEVYNGITENGLPGYAPAPPSPQPYGRLICTRAATQSSDGYEGRVELQIFQENSGGSKVFVTSYDDQNNWRRQSLGANVAAYSDKRGGWLFMLNYPASLEHFNFNYDGRQAYGTYRLLAVETTASNRSEVFETWNGNEPFSCTGLPQ